MVGGGWWDAAGGTTAAVQVATLGCWVEPAPCWSRRLPSPPCARSRPHDTAGPAVEVATAAERAALPHHSLLKPQHMRRGKGGRQAAPDPRLVSSELLSGGGGAQQRSSSRALQLRQPCRYPSHRMHGTARVHPPPLMPPHPPARTLQDPNIDPRRAARIMANRLAAARSKAKQQSQKAAQVGEPRESAAGDARSWGLPAGVGAPGIGEPLPPASHYPDPATCPSGLCRRTGSAPTACAAGAMTWLLRWRRRRPPASRPSTSASSWSTKCRWLHGGGPGQAAGAGGR